MMRIIIAVSSLIFALFALGCEPGSDIEFVNQTAERLCYYTNEGDFSFCQVIEPGETRTYGKVCGSNSARSVLVTLHSSREYIYSRSEGCNGWDNVTVTISQQDGRFVVTDTLDSD